MIKKLSFADKIIQYNKKLSCITLNLPNGFRVVNPFAGESKEQVQKITNAFNKKYYEDNKPRYLILGSSPARRGTAVTGVPFEDAVHLQKETGIMIKNFYINKASSNFLYDVIEKYGGVEKFYTNFYLNFVCPLGIVKTNSKGNEINCNFYDSKELQISLYDFIVESVRTIISFGIDTSVCFCIGSGKNFLVLNEINKKYKFFNAIIPLEHPRYIMQYNSQNKEKFLNKYLDALGNRL